MGGKIKERTDGLRYFIKGTYMRNIMKNEIFFKTRWCVSALKRLETEAILRLAPQCMLYFLSSSFTMHKHAWSVHAYAFYARLSVIYHM